jgi:O-antigen/teichoic acid export membrane protein
MNSDSPQNDPSKNNFRRHVLQLMSGSAVAQALPVIASFFLGRIYSPEDFALMQTLLTFAGVLGFLASLQYELAIMIPERDEDARSVLHLCLMCSLLFSVVSTLVFFIFGHRIADSIGVPSAGHWMPSIGILIFFTTTYRALSLWHNRKQLYSKVGAIRVWRSVVLVALMMLMPYIWKGAAGLVVANILQQVVASAALFKSAVKNSDGLTTFTSIESLREVARTHRKFALFSAPGGIINTMAANLPVFFLGRSFGEAVLGHWSMTTRIIAGPMSILSSTFSEVYFEKASREADQKGNCVEIWKWSFRRLMTIGIPIFLVLAIFGPWLVPIVIGKNWKLTGEFAQATSLLVLFNFVMTPLAMTFYVMHKQLLDLCWGVGLLVLVGLSFMLGVQTGSPYWTVVYYSFGYSVMCAINLVMTYRSARSIRALPSENDIPFGKV